MTKPVEHRPRTRLRDVDDLPISPGGAADGTNPDYIAWLRAQSMLADAIDISRALAAVGPMFRQPYAIPDPHSAVTAAPVWFTAYPSSMITAPGQSFLAALGDPDIWKAFEDIGIKAVHTGPVKISGGISGWTPTPSVDGHFDRVSTRIDPAFGTAEEFREMCLRASEAGATVLDDIVPGHTGKGADFRLAEMRVDDYAGIYHMVEIAPEHWSLLPEIWPGADATNLDVAAEAALAAAGYIEGRLQRVIFAEPGIKETNWSATAPVVGPDGVARRWVYLHYFKAGQPSVNWLDPTMAGVRLVLGDALHSLTDLGSGGLRLDANGFLGIEPDSEGGPAWSEGHPLSDAANQVIAGLARKVGAFSFQELNLTIEDIARTARYGADLSYDFVTRPAYHHALATADTEFLRLTLRESKACGVSPVGLVHALQNHDELTYELVHYATTHADDSYHFRGRDIPGAHLAQEIRQDLLDRLAGPSTPYNRVFTTNGIASTTASVITAVLGWSDISALDEEQVEKVRRAHLLLAMFNAWQPGVVALSGWDMVGMLPLPIDQVADLVADGDTRWIHRAAYDLLGTAPMASSSRSGMPRGTSLYGDLRTQLGDDSSFVRRLARILDVREASGVATADQLDVPDVADPAVLVMVHRSTNGDVTATVLNFGGQALTTTVSSAALPRGASVTDASTGEVVGVVSEGGIDVALDGHHGRLLRLTGPASEES